MRFENDRAVFYRAYDNFEKTLASMPKRNRPPELRAVHDAMWMA
jgi:hypothetical protein